MNHKIVRVNIIVRELTSDAGIMNDVIKKIPNPVFFNFDDYLIAIESGEASLPAHMGVDNFIERILSASSLGLYLERNEIVSGSFNPSESSDEDLHDPMLTSVYINDDADIYFKVKHCDDFEYMIPA